MKDLEEFRKAGEDIYHRLHLSTYPVAIKYIQDIDEIPDGFTRPSMFGKKLTLCQAFTQARRWGAKVAMTSEDNLCTPSTAAHRWSKVSFDDLVESQVIQGWHKDSDAEKKRLTAGINILGEEGLRQIDGYHGFICSPLIGTVFVPDTVLVYCDGLQLTHIIHALCYEYKYVPTSSFDGFAESCIKGGLIPFATKMPQVVIPGSGDRALAGTGDSELAIGMPGFLVFYVLDNLFKTGSDMNIGYPMRYLVPTDLDENITPGFKFLRERMDKK